MATKLAISQIRGDMVATRLWVARKKHGARRSEHGPRWAFPAERDRDPFRRPAGELKSSTQLPSLKGPFLSRAAWWIFLRTICAKAFLGFLFWLRSRFRGLIDTVILIEVLCAVLFLAAAPLSIPSWIRLPFAAVAQVLYEPDTELFCCDRLAGVWPSQSKRRSASEAESIGNFRLAFALARASSWSGRADATVTRDSVFLFVDFPMVPGSPFRLRRRFSDAKLNARQIDKVVLVGGASRPP
ncbi:MAG: hypothetical protein GXY83_21940 [Rhodopirellula sp.]|nr:hypothetical protein [Rhodopirellula sp.]